MQLLRLDESHPDFDAALALYERNFPKEERRDRDRQLAALKDGAYFFCGIYEGGFVVIMGYWQIGGEVFLEHFAVSENRRGEGLGGTALALLKSKGRVILEIELPTDDLKKRRRAFYLRNGFTENAVRHIQVKYRTTDPDLPLLILTNEPLSKPEYDAFYRALRQTLEKYRSKN